jgi:predicted ATP-dependent serine protease
MNNTTTIAQVLNEKTKPTPMPTNYREWFFHLPYDKPFVMSMGGEPFTGKTSFTLKLLTVLCQRGDEALYLNIEEPLRRGATIQDKCRQMKLSKSALKNIHILNGNGPNSLDAFKKELDKKEYKYCVIDSISMLTGNSRKMHDEIWEWVQSRNESFICVLHFDKYKSGSLKGPVIWEHGPDVVVWLKNEGYLNTQAEFKKNRYFPHNIRKRKFNTYTAKVI